jgi:hypothetical protein
MVVVPNSRIVAIVGRGVNRDVFTKYIPMANPYARVSAFEFQVLRFTPETRKRKNFTARTQHGVSFDGRVMVQAAAVSDYYARSDKRISPDGDV